MSVLQDGGVAVAAGFIAAGITYVFGRVALRPRLHAATGIRLRDYAGRTVAQIKIHNSSPFRAAIGLSLAAVVVVPLTDTADKKRTKRSILRIPLEPSTNHTLRLDPLVSRVTALGASNLSGFTAERLKQLGQNRLVNNEDRSIVQLLSLRLLKDGERRSDEDNEPHVLVTVNCKDSVTGRDFSFLLPPFHLADVGYGHFDDPHHSLIARRVSSMARRWQQRRQARRAIGFTLDADDERNNHPQ